MGNITQSIELPAAAEKLFEMYLDPQQHAEFTNKPVDISPEIGSAFFAFEGMLSGTMLSVVAPHLVVQAWRSVSFHEHDPDSTLILCFSNASLPGESPRGRIDLVHLNIPEHDHEGVNQGWRKFYWEPWRAFLDAV